MFTISLITVSELKEQLTLLGVDYSAYTDVQLGQLLSNFIVEIEGSTGVDINPGVYRLFINDFDSKLLELTHYPVTGIISFTLDGKDYPDTGYALDSDLGVIYFNTHQIGVLRIEYTCQAPGHVINTIVNPLIVDMFNHMLTSDNGNLGEMSSIKEDNVQVSFDTSTNLYGAIQTRLNLLRGLYSCRAILI